MNEKQAKTLVGFIGPSARAVQSGGDIWVVEIDNEDLRTTVVLGEYGWMVKDVDHREDILMESNA